MIQMIDNQSKQSVAAKVSKKILLVEDDQVLAKMYSQRLASEGYEVLTAADGEEGLKIALETDLNLVITDIMLPRVSGIELVEKLRKTKKYSKTPIIAWSNLADESEKETALRVGANDY